MRAVYEYPARTLPSGKTRAAVTLTWYQGTERPQQVIDGTVPDWGSGCLFVGSKGMLLADYGKQKEERGEPFALAEFFGELNAVGVIPLSLIRWQMTGLDDMVPGR